MLKCRSERPSLCVPHPMLCIAHAVGCGAHICHRFKEAINVLDTTYKISNNLFMTILARHGNLC